MISIEKFHAGGHTTLVLTGNIDEHFNIADVLEEATGKVTLDCAAIQRINSSGVKSWMQTMRAYAAAGGRVTLVNLPQCLVEQVNMVINFAKDTTIESFQLPYSCSHCGYCFVVTDTPEHIRKKGKPATQQPCPKCTKAGSFDEIPESYCAFALKG